VDRVVYRCSLLPWPPTTLPPEAPRDILVHLEGKGRTSVLKIIVREASCKNFQSGLLSWCSRGHFGLVQSSISSITETHSYET